MLVAEPGPVPDTCWVRLVGKVPVLGRDGSSTLCTTFSMFNAPSVMAVFPRPDEI